MLRSQFSIWGLKMLLKKLKWYERGSFLIPPNFVVLLENQDANFEKCYIYNIFTINHKCWQIISKLKSNFNGKFKLELWGQRIWQPQLISYQVQGPHLEGRNVRRRTKKVQTARRRCRGQSCSRQTEITEGRSGTPPKAVSQSVLKERTSAMSQPWEYSGGAIPG